MTPGGHYMYQANSFSWHYSGASNGDERCFTDYLVLPGGHCEVRSLNFVCLSSLILHCKKYKGSASMGS